MSQDFLHESLQIDYRLRATFFYRKLYDLGFKYFHDEIFKLIEIADTYNWEQKNNWGVSETAWMILEKSKIPQMAVFAHPRVLQEQSKLSAYYRSVAMLPQKAVNKLAFTIKSIEEGKKLSADKSVILCQLYNSHSSLIIESANEYTQDDIYALMYASAGAQIQGSWNNKIGEEAEILTRKLIIRTLLEQDLIVSTIYKEGNSNTQLNNLIEQTALISGIRLKNQTSILFSSEPDISFLNANGELVAVIEVKGGKDTAGALERYGAAKKSFEEARRLNPEVITIFLANCITQEVNKRLKSDELVTNIYDLTQIVSKDEFRQQFAVDILKFIKIDLKKK
ncbi:XcyI family restriction endonuclease [Crocosphaera sp. UHCC 0190]|uniref:XcyI family restriction endonuclease n=1 Tax=Crocosphaera sp. UHCC 0190 TaxID=3110246 RepID=UPI002B1FFE2B|nr:XcyI family restriction endonuclease [Crocosphaera sp. UHCC 0190]MEA5510324.1 XcyI family restriction endonuclease [Crocosphaera sp. UHCC 0190]